MFCPLGGGATTFKFPVERKLRIEGCATKEDLANPAEFDSEGQRCLIVGKETATLPTSPSDATPAWCHSLSTKLASSPSSSASTTRASRVPKLAGDKNDKWCEYAISAGRKGRGRR
jgi:hypothetical protein